jgi:hypothetical protein
MESLLFATAAEPSGAPDGYPQTMPTRWLLVAAAVTAVLIALAGFVWLLWFL